MRRNSFEPKKRSIANQIKHTKPAALALPERCFASYALCLARACTLLRQFDLRYIRPVYSQLDAIRPVKDKRAEVTRTGTTSVLAVSRISESKGGDAATRGSAPRGTPALKTLGATPSAGIVGCPTCAE